MTKKIIALLLITFPSLVHAQANLAGKTASLKATQGTTVLETSQNFPITIAPNTASASSAIEFVCSGNDCTIKAKASSAAADLTFMLNSDTGTFTWANPVRTLFTVGASGLITLPNGSTGVSSPINHQVTAAGTTISDAFQLGGVYNSVGTVAAGAGVKLWNVEGINICTVNNGANDLLLYPPSAGGIINGGSAGAAVTLAAATGQRSCCFRTDATSWWCDLTDAA